MRTTIQTKMNELSNIESGRVIADDLLEDGKTYFGFEIREDFRDRDYEKNCTNRLSITGYVTRLINLTENTQELVDNATYDVIDKLKELNFNCSYEDVSIDNGVCKMLITAYADYNEINNKFI